MGNYLPLIFLISYVVAFLIGFYLDPTGKYRRVLIKILADIKEVTPDNIDAVIDAIIKGFEQAGLNPNSRVAKKMISEVREKVNQV
ncbi:MAG: hypothetical protein ACTSPB_01995 [Candidatus Thorarchaeota archaeon]